VDVNHDWYRWQGTTLVLRLRVHPGAKAEQAESIHGGRIKVKTTAPPVDGRANVALARWLAREFAVPRRDIELIRGATSRNKDVAITNPDVLPAWFTGFGGGRPSCGR
tara:strand:- start:7509 stop:7832 length:324 start_codon:yes stop_codon:yes gene_type:complete